MNTQQIVENPDQLGRIIDILYTYDKSEDNSEAKSQDKSELLTTMNPPLTFRSDIFISTPQIQSEFDFERYRTGDYKVDDIIYHLEFSKMKQEKDYCLYTFNYKLLVPKSQAKNFEVWVTNDFGAKLLKTKSSTTRIEIYLEPITLKQEANNKDNNSSSRKVTANVNMGIVSGKFKERYSNTVTIDLLVKYV